MGQSATSGETDWSTEIAGHIHRQKSCFERLEVQLLQMSVSAMRLTVTTQAEIEQALGPLEAQVDEVAFEHFVRAVLMDSDGYDRPYGDIRIVISPERSYEESIIPGGAAMPITRERRIQTPKGAVTAQETGNHSQALLTPTTGRRLLTPSSIDSFRYRPRFIPSRFQLVRAEEDFFEIDFQTEEWQEHVLFHRPSGLVFRDRRQQHSLPETDIWQFEPVKVGPGVLPRVYVQAQYRGGKLSHLVASYLVRANAGPDVAVPTLELPKKTVVADLRQKTNGIPKTYMAPPVKSADELLDFRKRDEAQTPPARRGRILFFANVIALGLLAIVIAFRRVRKQR